MVDQQSIQVNVPRWKQRLLEFQFWYVSWRFRRGYKWASDKWNRRDQDWANSSFDQVDRDGYCVALIQGELGPLDGELGPYDRGIKFFLEQLRDGHHPTPLRYTNHPLFREQA